MNPQPHITSLLAWFNDFGRTLPWRNIQDHYQIWVSEIILQQTRIQQGYAYYERFIAIFPDVFSLSESSLESVLKAWEGLGYYARARNMHKCAKILVSEYQGRFPQDLEILLKLPGIGPYTARAIASFAFSQEVAVLDGNVFRILSRYYADTTPVNSPQAKTHYQNLADSWVKNAPSADFNAAMMDLGSLICTPQKPKCSKCPFSAYCKAYLQNIATHFPVFLPPKVRSVRYIVFQLIFNALQDKIQIQKRPESGLWGGLWELPNYEVTETEWNYIVAKRGIIKPIKHILTHITYQATTILDNKEQTPNGIWADKQKISELPLSKLTHKIIELLPKKIIK